MTETQKTLAPAIGHLNTSAQELRQFRAVLDSVTHTLDEDLHEQMQATADEATKLIARLGRMQESFRSACLKGSK